MIGVLDPALPPHSVEAEQAILSGVLWKPPLFLEVADLLEPEHFYRTPHQLIYRAMSNLHRLNEKIDVVTVAENLNDSGDLDAAGGRPYLADLALRTVDCFWPVPESVRHWAKKIREYAGHRMMQAALQDALSVGETSIAGIQAELVKAAALLEPAEEMGILEAIENAFGRIEMKLSGGGVTGLSTGFPRLDGIMNGIEPNRLIILAARSGNGKTAFSLNIAKTMILTHRRPVLFFSLEMKADELMERMIKLVAESDNDRQRLAYARQVLEQHKDLFIIKDGTDYTVTDIQNITKRELQKAGGLGLVVVDYIGKVKPNSDSKRYQNKSYEVEGTTWGLKTLAKSHSLPVLALCQMNRGIENRGDKNKPQLSDLKDSGAVEQDADTVLFLTSEDDQRTAPKLTIAKQRNGAAGEIQFYFQGNIFKFTEARYGAY